MRIATAFSLLLLSVSCAVPANAGPSQIGAITNPPGNPNPSRLLNISARASVGTGNRVAIAGFITEGDAKNIVVRAIGPSLQVNGTPITGRLQDTTLDLFAGDQNLTSNDDWRQTQRPEIEGTGLAPAHDLESVILRNLAAGAYTAIARGKNQTSGIGLIEVYDRASSATSQIKNLSTRAFTGAGDDVLIGGFIAGGGAEVHLLLRVLGPSLTGAGITDALQDPVIELFDANGEMIGMNDNWGDDLQFLIQETGLAPPRAVEAALLVDLAPGNYTALARGRNGTSGTALLEIYNVPPSPLTDGATR